MNPAEAIALVTGANKGLGKEISRQLAAQGVFVLLGARDRERGEKASRRPSRWRNSSTGSIFW